MALDPQRLIDHDFPEVAQPLTPRDASLYALGIGLGDDPLADARLRFVYEEHPEFVAVPTQPMTMGFFRWVLIPELGIDVTRVVHGEERLTLHGPVPIQGRVISKVRITGVEDKGESRGALVFSRRDIRLEGAETHFATVETTTFCRGDGGCGSAGKTRRLSGPVPDSPADISERIAIAAEAALIYRLSGDYNPLHIDPAYAQRAGFGTPILHGLCTLAIAARAVWTRLEDPGMLAQIACRFSDVVYPGDTLAIALWTGHDSIRFSAHVGDRIVLDRGTAVTDRLAKGRSVADGIGQAPG